MPAIIRDARAARQRWRALVCHRDTWFSRSPPMAITQDDKLDGLRVIGRIAANIPQAMAQMARDPPHAPRPCPDGGARPVHQRPLGGERRRRPDARRQSPRPGRAVKTHRRHDRALTADHHPVRLTAPASGPPAGQATGPERKTAPAAAGAVSRSRRPGRRSGRRLRARP